MAFTQVDKGDGNGRAFPDGTPAPPAGKGIVHQQIQKHQHDAPPKGEKKSPTGVFD